MKKYIFWTGLGLCFVAIIIVVVCFVFKKDNFVPTLEISAKDISIFIEDKTISTSQITYEENDTSIQYFEDKKGYVIFTLSGKGTLKLYFKPQGFPTPTYTLTVIVK